MNGSVYTTADFNRRLAASLGSGEAPRAIRGELDGVTDAMKTLRAHVKDDHGLDLMASAPPTIGPARPIPEDPPFNVPEGPVNEAEYERLMADKPAIGGESPEQDMARLSEFFTAAAAVAPWNIRPALAVMAVQMQDIFDGLQDPTLADQPGRVTSEQTTAASTILSWDDQTTNDWKRPRPSV